MDEPLSVRAVLGHLWSALSGVLGLLEAVTAPLRAPLRALAWDIGDWTFFTPVVVYLLYRLYSRVRHRPPSWRHGFAALLIGLVLGGILEHQQPALEARLAASE